MPKNSFLKAIFSGPKFSIAPIEENNRGTIKLGQVVPVWSTILNPREGVTLDMSHLVRMLPAKAPVMEGYKVTFDAFAVPYSCLGYAERKEREIDDFFNIKQNGGEVQNPFCFSMDYLRYVLGKDFATQGVDGLSLASAFELGTLGDYINFPSLKNVREHVRKWLAVNPFLPGSASVDLYCEATGVDIDNAQRFMMQIYLNAPEFLEPAGYDYHPMIYQASSNARYLYLAIPFSKADNPFVIESSSDNNNYYYVFDELCDVSTFGMSGCAVRSLVGYVFEHYPIVAEHFAFDKYGGNLRTYYTYLSKLDDFDFLKVLYDNYKVDAQSIYNEYFEYVMSKILYNNDLVNVDGGLLYNLATDTPEETFLPSLPNTELIDLSYLAAYWKIISDWYINTNIDGDPEDFFLEHCHILTNSELSTRPAKYLDLRPFVRRWSNDIFTSAVPMAQVQNIRIPADGTIPDLREANAYQKLVDIFRNTGNRLRDVVYGVFGITPSAVRSEMSEPIGSLSSWVGFQSVLQTSETTPDSPQAAYAGIGTDSSNGYKHILKYVNNDEPTPVIVMVLMSVTQRATYMQGFDRKFFRKSIYDFAIPELAMIGEQEVTNKEVYFDKNYEDGVFGFNRRYYDWFYSGSQVHGDLRDSMDYWHGARVFDSQPALNSEFIGINTDADHLQRVFANISEAAAPIVYNIAFNGYKTVALPRYIQYEL